MGRIFGKDAAATKGGGRLFSSTGKSRFKDLEDTPLAAKRREEERLKQFADIQGTLERGVASGAVESLSTPKAPSLGDRVFSGTNALVGAVTSPFKQGARVSARAIESILGTGNEEGLQAANRSLEASQEGILRLLRDPKIPKARKDILLGALNETAREQVLQATQNTQQVESDTDIKKNLGAAAQIASLGFGGGSLVSAARAGNLGKAAAATTASGALGGAGYTLQEDEDAGIKDLIKSAAVGGAVGLALPTAGAAISQKFAQRGARQASTVISEIDNQIANTTNKVQLRALNRERDFVRNQVISDIKSKQVESLLTGNRRVAGQARTTEARAIREGLTEGIDDLATYEATTWDNQTQAAVDIMNTDFEAAKRIALGTQDPPEGVLVNAIYKGVENRAVKEGNSELLAQLAQSPVASRTSRFAQELGALGVRDPESPVVAMQDILKARKDSALKIPQAITQAEADKITSLAQEVANAKAALVNGGSPRAYGDARVAYDNYIADLVQQANKKSLREALKTPGTSAVDAATRIAGTTKSLRASLDNSVLLRQGWKTLLTHPGTWAKNSRKSFVDWVRAAGGKPVLDEVKSDIISRQNSLNGMYKRMGVDVFGIREEAFPTSLPERIPLAGRAFKGSEAAYTAWQQRTRADLADKYLEIAQRSGVDLTSDKELKSIGKLVNSLTGRGYLGTTGERTAKLANNVFFSPRLLKSNLDVLTAHQFQSGASSFVKKQAAKNLLQIAAGSAAALKLAQEVTGGKVEWDPRSSNFGKVQIGDTRFDLSGGMSSIATLGARLATKSSKSSTTGEIKKLGSGDFGATTGKDVFYNFFENKLSPAAGAISDIMEGKDFEGNKPTVQSTIKNLTLPLIINSYQDLKDNPRATAVLPTLIAEGLGISVNTYGLDSNWNANNSKRVKGFKEKVSPQTFKQANEEFNKEFNDWYRRVSESDSFWSLPQEKRESLVTSKKDSLTDEVLARKGYKYTPQKTDKTTQNLIDALSR